MTLPGASAQRKDFIAQDDDLVLIVSKDTRDPNYPECGESVYIWGV